MLRGNNITLEGTNRKMAVLLPADLELLLRSNGLCVQDSLWNFNANADGVTVTLQWGRSLGQNACIQSDSRAIGHRKAPSKRDRDRVRFENFLRRKNSDFKPAKEQPERKEQYVQVCICENILADVPDYLEDISCIFSINDAGSTAGKVDESSNKSSDSSSSYDTFTDCSSDSDATEDVKLRPVNQSRHGRPYFASRSKPYRPGSLIARPTIKPHEHNLHTCATPVTQENGLEQDMSKWRGARFARRSKPYRPGAITRSGNIT